MFIISTNTSTRISNMIFSTYRLFLYTHMDFYCYSTIDLKLDCLSSNLHLHSHDICFVNVFGSFIPVILLNMLKFKSSVLFGTYTLLDKSLKVLQLRRYLSNSTVNR